MQKDHYQARCKSSTKTMKLAAVLALLNMRIAALPSISAENSSLLIAAVQQNAQSKKAYKRGSKHLSTVDMKSKGTI